MGRRLATLRALSAVAPRLVLCQKRLGNSALVNTIARQLQTLQILARSLAVQAKRGLHCFVRLAVSRLLLRVLRKKRRLILLPRHAHSLAFLNARLEQKQRQRRHLELRATTRAAQAQSAQLLRLIKRA
jgi:hypothetical protein